MSISKVGSSAGVTALRGISVTPSFQTHIRSTVVMLTYSQCHVTWRREPCTVVDPVRSLIASSYNEPQTWSSLYSWTYLWSINVTSKEAVRGWWWDNKNSRGSSFKQVWILRWINLVKEIVMKTLAPTPPTEFKEFCDDCIPVSERLVKTSY